jgi:soluble cytochrome b562
MKALKKMSDVDLQSLVELSKNKSGDAKQLAEETYRDILKILQEKADKAKKIAKEGADEANSKTS